MIDSWSWFRERADVELGDVPPEPDDRLEAVVARAAAPSRRRLSEIGAAAGVAVIALALVGATVVLSRQDPASSGPMLPAPAEFTDQTDLPTPAPAPGEVGNGSPTRTTGPGGRLPGRTTSATAPATTRNSASGTPSAPTSTTPRRSTSAPPPPVTTSPTPSPTVPPTTTEPPPPTTTPPPVVP